MIEVVRFKDDSISVRDDKIEGLSICFKCRGFKRITVVEALNSWGSDLVIAAGYYEACPVCSGVGLFFAQPTS